MLTMRSSLRRRLRRPFAAELRPRVLLLAHPLRLGELLAWVRTRRDALRERQLFADDATRATMAGELRMTAAELRSFLPEPLRRDDGRRAAADLLVLFWDPAEAHPRDAAVRALLATAVRHGISLACTPRAADVLLLAAPRPDALAALLPSLDERRWAPELALTPGRSPTMSSHSGETQLVDRHGSVQRGP